MALEALLFDVDGTLADTERDGHRIAFNMAFAAAGPGWEWDVPLYGKLLAVTGGKERIRYYLDNFNTTLRGLRHWTILLPDCTRPRRRTIPRCWLRALSRCALVLSVC